MAVLGYEGTVYLSREWPLPTIISDARLTGGSTPGLDISEPAFWSGDRVIVFSERGVPFDTTGSIYPDCPKGYSFYGDGPYAVGPAVKFRTAGGRFYGPPSSYDLRPFYESDRGVGLTKSFIAYIHRDSMDNIRFYSDEISAINGDSRNLIPLFNVAFGKLVIANYIDDFQYLEFLSDVAERALNGEMPILLDEQPVENLPTDINSLVLDPDVRGWKRQGGLTEWIFEMDAGQLDQTSVGDAFGEFAKGTLSGSGSFNAIFSNEKKRQDSSSSDMLKMLTLTARGARAKARFKMDTIFYEADILFFKTNISNTLDDVIKMNAEFISTGPVRIVPG